MKIEFLTGLGIAEDVAKKIVAQSDKDVSDVQTQLKDTQKQLGEANTTIKSYKDMDVDSIKKSANDYKQKLEQSETDRKTFEHKTKIDGYVKSLGLKDDVYEKYITDTLIEKGLQFEGDKLIGGEDVVNSFKETHADAFKSDTPPADFMLPSGGSSPSQMSGIEQAFYAINPNLKS